MNQLSEYQAYLIEEERGALTVEKYMRDVQKFIIWLGDRELLKKEIMTYKAYLVEKYAISSVNSMLSALNSYLAFCGKSEYRVKTVKTQRDNFCCEEKQLNRMEYERLLQAAKKDQRLALLMQTICATGIRVSEHKYITVAAIAQGKARVHCKGKIRTVLLPRKLCSILMAYARRRRIKKGSIFVTKSGKPLDRSRIWAQMKKLCAAAKVNAEKVFPHNLRHLFARTFYSIEKDVVRLADILGHSSVNTTRIYTQESGEVHRKQIEKMPLIYIT